MKRTMKKVFALALAVMLVMALTVSAFAGEAKDPGTEITDCTITIETTVENPGTFSAYQIFSGRLAKLDGKTVLTNIQWGNALEEADYGTALTAVRAVDGFASCKTPEDIAKVLQGVASEEDPELAQKFADAIAPYLKKANASSVTGTGKTVTITVPQVGYYMVKSDDAPANSQGYAATRYMLEVVGAVNVTEKASVPSVEKKVLDANDSNAADPTNTWGDTADHDIGDPVPFQLTGTLPSDYEDYEEPYKFVFHDQLSTGLTFNNDVTVTVNGTEIDKNKYSVTTGVTDGCSFEVVFANLKAVDGLSAGSKIVVTYTATLNKDAVIGNPGNPNTVYLEFSNNPNSSGEGDTGKTPPDKVVVFTFELDVNKVTPNATDGYDPLAGAGFTLSKKNAGGSYNDIYFKPASESDKTYYVVASPTEEGAKAEISGSDLTEFKFAGLDDGDYKLTEKTTPPGYNTIDPVEFTVTATHDGTTQALTDVTFKSTGESSDAVQITSGKGGESGEIGIGSMQVVNNKGTQLPSTGGMGTTILYIVGGVLAVGAAVILVVRKRMQSRQQSNQ